MGEVDDFGQRQFCKYAEVGTTWRYPLNRKVASSSDVSEGTINPSGLVFTPSNWDTAQTVSVTGVDDLLEDGDQPYQVDLTIDPANTTDTSGYADISIDPVSVTNIDNDFPSVDSDGDEIPDGWEVYFGLDPDDPDDAAGDPDNDGVSNLLEFIKNTDPNASDNFDVSHMIISGSGFLLHVTAPDPDLTTFAMFRVPQGGGEEEITSGFYSGSGTAENPFVYQWDPGSPYTSMETDTPDTGDTTYTVTFHLYANGSELPSVYTVTYKEYASDENREADIPSDLLEIETFYGQTRPVVVYTQHVFDPSQSDEFTLVIQDPANPGEYESLTINIPTIPSAYLFIDDSDAGHGGNLNYDSQTDFYDIDTSNPGYQAFNPADFLLVKAAYYDFEDPVVADGLSISLDVASGAYQGSVVKYNPIQKPDGSGRDANAPTIELSLYLNPEAEAYDELNRISGAQRLVSFMMSEKGDGVHGFARQDLFFSVYDDGFVIFDINHLTTFGVVAEEESDDGRPNNGNGLCFISAVATQIPVWWIIGFAVALIALAMISLNHRKILPNQLHQG
ncbi:MAG: hypothetical protein GY850_03880 [bacterium]|nr:hypothetical protein [bacterium]